MNFIGIELHKTSSQVCILTEGGELIERRIKTDRESFDKMFAGTPPARIIVESLTESEWCARHLEAFEPRHQPAEDEQLVFLRQAVRGPVDRGTRAPY